MKTHHLHLDRPQTAFKALKEYLAAKHEDGGADDLCTGGLPPSWFTCWASSRGWDGDALGRLGSAVARRLAARRHATGISSLMEP